jgi:hypothetical protein
MCLCCRREDISESYRIKVEDERGDVWDMGITLCYGCSGNSTIISMYIRSFGMTLRDYWVEQESRELVAAYGG